MERQQLERLAAEEKEQMRHEKSLKDIETAIDLKKRELEGTAAKDKKRLRKWEYIGLIVLFSIIGTPLAGALLVLLFWLMDKSDDKKKEQWKKTYQGQLEEMQQKEKTQEELRQLENERRALLTGNRDGYSNMREIQQYIRAKKRDHVKLKQE